MLVFNTCMKVNSISFGTTYLRPSIRNLSDENKKKLKSLYPLGYIYPVDLYLGGDRKGNLTLEIKHASMYEYLLKNHKIEQTPENIILAKVVKAAENTHKYLYGDKTPVKKATIDYIDYIPEDILPYYVADEIEDYNKEYFKKFGN